MSGRADRAMREPILVKRYAGYRLYDTAKARYVTVEELREWRARGIPFEVREADTGEDVSQVLLA
jgi:polyhydroxyalkanoate synthesis regulator protein